MLNFFGEKDVRWSYQGCLLFENTRKNFKLNLVLVVVLVLEFTGLYFGALNGSGSEYVLRRTGTHWHGSKSLGVGIQISRTKPSRPTAPVRYSMYTCVWRTCSSLGPCRHIKLSDILLVKSKDESVSIGFKEQTDYSKCNTTRCLQLLKIIKRNTVTLK